MKVWKYIIHKTLIWLVRQSRDFQIIVGILPNYHGDDSNEIF